MTIRKRPNKKSKKGYVYEVYLYYNYYGKTKQYSKSGFITKTEALEHESIKRIELSSYGNLVVNHNKTLKDVYNEFLELGSVEFQYNTIYNTKKTLSKWYGEKATLNLGDMKIKEIDYQILQKYFTLRKDCGKSTNEDIKSALRRIFLFAIRCGYIRSNPLEFVKVVGKENKKEIHVLTFIEYQRILEELKNKNTFEYDAISMAIKIGFFTGMRLSEIMALHKEDLDLKNDTINIHRKLIYKGLKKHDIQAIEQMKSKSSKATIPMPYELKKELINWFEINPYKKVICDEDGNYFNPDSVGNRLRAITKKIGISFHFHLLRHTYATMLVNANVEPKITQELLRHASFNTTMSIYVHTQEEKKKNIVNEVFNQKYGENMANLHKNKNTLP